MCSTPLRKKVEWHDKKFNSAYDISYNHSFDFGLTFSGDIDFKSKFAEVGERNGCLVFHRAATKLSYFTTAMVNAEKAKEKMITFPRNQCIFEKEACQT